MGSPSPAGSYNRSRRDRDRRGDGYRQDARHRDRRDRDFDREVDKDRDLRRRRSRSRSPVDHRRYRDRRDRIRDQDRELDRGRERGGGDYHNTGDRRERQRQSTNWRRSRSRSRSRESQRYHARMAEETAIPAPVQSEADKKAERLLRLEAWKKKMESKGKEKMEEAGQAQKSQADEKAAESLSVASPAIESPGPESVDASPATPYAGKFDPKAIAKKSAASRPQTGPEAVPWGSTGNNKGVVVPPALVKQTTTASALPANRGNLSKFGFQKPNDKLPSKRNLVLDEEETSKRQLTKLPTLPTEPDDAIYVDQDDGEESDGADIFAENEEEAAAAARAAHERREGRMQVDPPAEQKDNEDGDPKLEPIEVEAANDQMDVDDDEDALDAFMADLEDEGSKKPKQAAVRKDQPEPETYFSEDDYTYEQSGDPNAKAILAINAKRKKKDIPVHNYSKLGLPPVRKNFWVEPAELSGLTEAEANELRMELDGIKVVGKDVPKPVQKWAQCGLTRQTLDTIERLGFEKPTPVQMQAIPAIMSGRDVIAVAKTGSGKTIAFLLPMFRHIMDQEPLKETDGPIGLIIAPTRELATQIHRECKPFLKAMKLRAVCTYGGAPIKDQIAELKRGAEIIVCTPGRLFDILAANQGRVTNLKRVTYAVMDEADRMFDMGFEPQIMKIFANMRPDRQTILFSATMPRIVDSLTKKVLQKPIEITVGGRSVVASEITQIVEVRPEATKFLRLLELLGDLYDRDEDARSLVFVDRQDKADDLLKDLMLKGYPCMSIHGGKDQVDRDSTISDFKRGIVPILIATSVAARGLDVKQLKLVVNYDAPNHLEDYVHRAGRTGRAGNTGTAVTFVTEDQENCAAAIAKALEQSGQPVPERLDEIRKAHWEKVKSGKSKDITGFGGRGLTRLDEERELARLRERKTHKAEGEEEDFKEDKQSEGERTQKAVSSINVAASAIIARDAPKPDSKTAADVDTSAVVSSKNPLDKVSSAVSAINSRLGKAGQLRTGQPIDNKGPDAGAYHATLPINDFPQKARWAVTNRTNVAKILEATGTSITTKGSFYAAGKEVPPGGDPKLYILIEGDTEVVVGSALAELKRLLLEGTMAAADAEGRAPTSGRYTVT